MSHRIAKLSLAFATALLMALPVVATAQTRGSSGAAAASTTPHASAPPMSSRRAQAKGVRPHLRVDSTP